MVEIQTKEVEGKLFFTVVEKFGSVIAPNLTDYSVAQAIQQKAARELQAA
jgi:hypothetical protein